MSKHYSFLDVIQGLSSSNWGREGRNRTDAETQLVSGSDND